jgi:hypothetical protein
MFEVALDLFPLVPIITGVVRAQRVREHLNLPCRMPAEHLCEQAVRGAFNGTHTNHKLALPVSRPFRVPLPKEYER